MPLYKEFFHKHTYGDVKYRNLPLNFKIRFEEAFGYYHEKVYTQTKKGRVRDYRTPWILFEDTKDNARRFAWVFHNFNIFTTLNYYKEKEVTKECFVDLAFDFDAEELEKARMDALKMSEFLQSKQVPYSLYFSGKKGFHIVIAYQAFNQEYQENNHLVNKKMTKLLLQETGPLESLDMAIYSSRRQLRLVNSRHSGSGLFKIPLTLDELAAGPDSILKLAEKQRLTQFSSFPVSSCLVKTEEQGNREPHNWLHNIYLQAKQNLARLPKYDVPKVDLSVLQGTYPPCIRECLEVGIKPGAKANRNETTMFLASFFKGQGMDMRVAQDKLTAHALGVLRPFAASSDTEIKSSTKTCVSSVYRSKKYNFNCQFARGKFKLRCNDTCRLYSKYKDTRSSRKLRYIEVQQPKATPAYTVEEIRDGIRTQIDAYLVDPQGKILLIKVPAGVGKTITTLTLLSFGMGRVFWVAGRKDLFANIPYECRFKWKQILGRHGGSYTDNGEVLVEANCQHADLAHTLGHKNHDINQHLCKGHCDIDIQKCDYFRQFHDREQHWFVQQPFFFYTRDNFVDPFDVVVIDEDILDGFKKETQITLADIQQNYELFKNTKEGLETSNNFVMDFYGLLNKEPQGLEPVNRNLDPVAKLLYVISQVAKSDIPFGNHETGKLILEKIRSIARKKLGEDIGDILKSIDDPCVFDKEIKFDIQDETNIPLNFFSYLYEVLYFEFFKKHPDNNLSRLFFQKRNIKTQEGSVCLENFLLINKIEKHTQKPIIILDATGKKLLYEKLFKRDVIEYAPRVKLENEIIQVYSSLNSKQSLSIKPRLQNRVEVIKKIVDREPSTLIVCKQVFKKSLEEGLPDSVQKAHFYGLRGSNEYQDFKQVVILGTPQNREDEIKKTASMVFYDEPGAVDTSVEYQDRPYMALLKDGLAPASKVRVFRDPRLQEINEVYREDEMLQALNRIRIAQDPDKRVIILSNVPLPGLPITKLVSLEELRGETCSAKLVEDLVSLSLDKLGFVCFRDIIDPLLNKYPANGEDYAKQAAKSLKNKFGLEFEMPADDKLSARTLRTYFGKTVADMKLEKLKLVNESSESGPRYMDIYAFDMEKARVAISGWFAGRFRVEKYPKAQEGY